MNREDLKQLWGETLRLLTPSIEQYERLAQSIVDRFVSGDENFRQHIKNRFGRVTNTTCQPFDSESFDLDMARAFIADEIGFTSWDQVINAVEHPGKYPLLFQYATAALWRGDFTSLESAVGGPELFDVQIKDWIEKRYFADEPETFAEAFAAACMLGHARSAEILLDAGVDPYAGMRTGLAGFHYAASSGRLPVIKLLTERKIPMEVENMYGGTVLGQALWSAVNEHTPDHAAIVEALINAGANIWPNTSEWWETQNPLSMATKTRIAAALRRAENG